MKRIHDGAIGELTTGRAYWNQGGLWSKPRESAWSGHGVAGPQLALLHLALRRPHLSSSTSTTSTSMNWAFKGHPTRAVGMGGRQVRTVQPEFGNIFDHFAVDYEYEGNQSTS